MDCLTCSPEELRAWWAGLTEDQRAWWAGLTEDQRGEVSFYADAAVWARIERVIGLKKGGGP